MVASSQEPVFAAFLDVLGFKDLAYNNTHAELQDVYNQFIHYAFRASTLGAYEVTLSADRQKQLVPDYSRAKVQMLVASDNVVLWTSNSSDEAFLHLLNAVRGLLGAGFIAGIPMRGGVARGQLSHVNFSPPASTFVGASAVYGTALVRAYELENMQEWSGCIVDSGCASVYKRIRRSWRHSAYKSLATGNVSRAVDLSIWDGLLYPDEVPIKGGRTITALSVYWPAAYPATAEQIREAFSRHRKSVDNEAVQRKIDNTVAYLRRHTPGNAVVADWRKRLSRI